MDLQAKIKETEDLLADTDNRMAQLKSFKKDLLKKKQ